MMVEQGKQKQCSGNKNMIPELLEESGIDEGQLGDGDVHSVDISQESEERKSQQQIEDEIMTEKLLKLMAKHRSTEDIRSKQSAEGTINKNTMNIDKMRTKFESLINPSSISQHDANQYISYEDRNIIQKQDNIAAAYNREVLQQADPEMRVLIKALSKDSTSRNADENKKLIQYFRNLSCFS